MDKTTKNKLIKAAFSAREKAYCPYSGFAVGAALLSKSGGIFTGANVENGSLSATVCAERSAVFSAVSKGEREFAAIAVVGGEAGKAPENIITPCGVCRQVLSEFCGGDFLVVCASEKESREYKLSGLMPQAFQLNSK